MTGRFKAIRCGRRWGKTKFGATIACDRAAKGQYYGLFAPDYKRLAETYRECAAILAPVTSNASQNAGIINTRNGGLIEFWTLEDENAGRSRRYHGVIMDEVAFAKDNMTAIWERSIEPTLLDFGGRAYAMSNTNGIAEENFFWRICNIADYGFVNYHAPTNDNPLLPLRRPGESETDHAVRRLRAFEALRAKTVPLVYQQEYLADFVDFSGASFFQRDKLLVNGQPVAEPPLIDAVFAVIDTAVKDGKEHDGTAVIYFGVSKSFGHPLVILDWDIVQIEGALLETWLPTVYQNLAALTQRIQCRMGSLGVFIEDKASGTILLQQAARRNWDAAPIESALTELGKDGRAISVSGYVYQELVKICQPAFDKVVAFKGITRNHLLTQLAGFKIGDKEAHKRADDLADCFMYGIAIALGNAEGF